MGKTITWAELNGFHRAYINDKESGFCYPSVENSDRWYWISGSKNGFNDSIIEAMKSIENVIRK